MSGLGKYVEGFDDSVEHSIRIVDKRTKNNSEWDIVEACNNYTSFLKGVLGYRRNFEYVLDLGCGVAIGPNGSTSLLERHATSIIGIDISLERLKEAQSRNKQEKYKFNFINADARHIPLREAVVEFVSDRGNVIIHMGKFNQGYDQKILNETSRVLIGGGKFISTFINDNMFVPEGLSVETYTPAKMREMLMEGFGSVKFYKKILIGPEFYGVSDSTHWLTLYIEAIK